MGEGGRGGGGGGGRRFGPVVVFVENTARPVNKAGLGGGRGRVLDTASVPNITK